MLTPLETLTTSVLPVSKLKSHSPSLFHTALEDGGALGFLGWIFRCAKEVLKLKCLRLDSIWAVTSTVLLCKGFHSDLGAWRIWVSVGVGWFLQLHVFRTFWVCYLFWTPQVFGWRERI